MGVKELIEIAKPYYEQMNDPSHDWSHVERVLGLAKRFGEELGADFDILIPAVYLHDLINIPKNSKHRMNASEYSANKAKEILGQFGYTDEAVQKISLVILEHSFSRGLSPTSLESQILQDADRLDAIGAIGIMRWASVGTKMGASFYHYNDPWGVERKELDDKSYSLDHFERKLLKLVDTLNTRPGKIEGKRRHEFMIRFLESLREDIKDTI